MILVLAGLAACNPLGQEDGNRVLQPATIIVKGEHDVPWVEFAVAGQSLVITVHSFGTLACTEHVSAERSVGEGNLKVAPRLYAFADDGRLCLDRFDVYQDVISVDPAAVSNRQMILTGLQDDTQQLVDVVIPFPDSQ